MNYLLGMDCGTTNIKAVIMDEEGHLVASASRPSRFIKTGTDGQEQDAKDWWENSKQIFKSMSEQAGEDVMKNIKGISISSHTVTLLPLDKDGEPLRYAVTYQDNRSAGELHEIVDKMGLDKFVSVVGGQPATAFLSNKILWLKKNEPEVFAKTAYLVQANGYINFKLTGNVTVDVDQGLRTQCMDCNTLTWSKEIGDVIGVDLDILLPAPSNIDDIIGYVTEDAAKETGLAVGTPVLAGCCDATASMYAAGLSKLGEAAESSGTTSLVFVGSAVKSPVDVPVVTRPCAIDGMPYVFDAPIQTSGAAIKWYIDTFAEEERAYAEEHGVNIYTYLNELALESKPGSDGLIFFPYLLGERAPLWNDHARGMFIGLGMNTKRSDLIRAVFEGTAYALRHVIETVKADGGKADILRICGGGAKSRTWAMIKASVLNMPVYLLDESAGDVPVGDVLIAGAKTGVFPSLTEAVEKIVKVKEIVEPVAEWVDAYDKMYSFYINMYKHLDQDLKELNRTVKDI